MTLTLRMASTRKRSKRLTEEQREQIRAMHKANPRMKYREIGAIFGVGIACVCITLNGVPPSRRAPPKPIPPPPPKVVMRVPTCSVPQPDSIISPIPLSRLMGGNTRRARTSLG